MGRVGVAARPTDQALVENSRVWTALYVTLALPLSLFLYVNAFQEATSFFGGSYGSWVLRAPFLSLLLVSALGAWMVLRLPLSARSWWAFGWLLLGATAGGALRLPELEWRQAAAVALCLPAWLSLRARWPVLWRESIRPVGGLSAWIEAGLLMGSSVVLSFTTNTLWISFTFPEFNASWPQRLFLAGRVAALAAGPALVAALPLSAAAILLRHRASSTRLILLALGSGFIVVAGLVLFNGLARLDPALVRPVNFLYVLALALPLALFFCERVITSGPSLAEGLLAFGRVRFLCRSENCPAWRLAIPLGCVALFFLVQCLLGTAHRYYEWGFGTSLFYCALSVGCTWWLLTVVPRRVQLCVSAVSLSVALLGCLTFLPSFHEPAVWAHYTKFDNNLGSLVRAYFRKHPRSEPEFATGRSLLDGSFELAPTNLVLLHQQTLVAAHPSHRPFVFFIVVDSLRAATYGGNPREQSRRYPGIAWMASRFVSYTNTWSSYNATFGSYPAYLNGVLNPVWYYFTSDWPIQHDNVLARAGALAHYSIYNLATFDQEFARLWPSHCAVELGSGGVGQGDPAIVFPRALSALDQHRRAQPTHPGLFYLHLYNVHQPLLRRPGVPFQGKGRHWMRALYEQNAAYFDLHLEGFLQGLEQRGILRDSLVVITGDHGEEVFDLGGLYHGWQINPWVMQVPLYVHYPEGTRDAPSPGTVSGRPVNLIDLAPTICQAMGVRVVRNSSCQGISLLSSEPSEPRSFLLLSWETPLVGRISFSPLRMLVLNFESGSEEAFVPGDHSWSMTDARVPATALAKSLTHDLRDMFRYWRMDPEKGTYLPSQSH